MTDDNHITGQLSFTNQEATYHVECAVTSCTLVFISANPQKEEFVMRHTTSCL